MAELSHGEAKIFFFKIQSVPFGLKSHNWSRVVHSNNRHNNTIHFFIIVYTFSLITSNKITIIILP